MPTKEFVIKVVILFVLGVLAAIVFSLPSPDNDYTGAFCDRIVTSTCGCDNQIIVHYNILFTKFPAEVDYQGQVWYLIPGTIHKDVAAKISEANIVK